MNLLHILCLLSALQFSSARNHTLKVRTDIRKFILLSSFGYFDQGTLDVAFGSFIYPDKCNKLKENVGFTLDKSTSAGTSSYVEQEEANENNCVVQDKKQGQNKPSIGNPEDRAVLNFDDNNLITVSKSNKSNLNGAQFDNNITYTSVKNSEGTEYSFSFAVHFLNNSNGLYELYFHNCDKCPVSFTVTIIEKNEDNYLSAGNMALPFMYGTMATLFFLAGFYWISVLWTTNQKVFIIHHLMGLLVIIKALSITFHSIDFYFISRDGKPEAWAVIFYVVHLLKGVLLFVCLLLIGTGWAFVKYVLNDNEKKLFVIVIPLQILANVGYSIIEDKDLGNSSYYYWKYSMFLVELLCCGAILIPVIWSVRYLQEASRTDGKAAQNLAKLELFQHFYVMVICYLYFTRIIVKLLEITLPFQLIWICKFFEEFGALVFFVLTGYKFRPGCNNPYLKLSQDDDDEESFAITQNGVTESISRVNQTERDILETTERDALISTSV